MLQWNLECKNNSDTRPEPRHVEENKSCPSHAATKGNEITDSLEDWFDSNKEDGGLIDQDDKGEENAGVTSVIPEIDMPQNEISCKCVKAKKVEPLDGILYRDDPLTPVFVYGKDIFEWEEIIGILLTNYPDNVYCVAPPVQISHNVYFLINVSKLKNVDDYKCDDMGAWKHNGVSKPPFTVDLGDQKRNYIVTRCYYKNKSSPDFSKVSYSLSTVLCSYIREEFKGVFESDKDEFLENASFLMQRLTERKTFLDAPKKGKTAAKSSTNGVASLKEKIDDRLKLIYGQNELKGMIEKLITRAYFDKQRIANNIGCSSVEETLSRLHMIFKGNPGTGKTSAARQIAGILFDIGIISKNMCIEVMRQDLVAEHIVGTATKTKAQIEKAMGEVLFVDEAYTLNGASANDFGKEAIETLMLYMTPSVTGDEHPVIILAGYTREMKKFLETNAGLERRIKNILLFEVYSPTDLAIITKNVIFTRGLRCPHGI